jgi:hypothetical protein
MNCQTLGPRKWDFERKTIDLLESGSVCWTTFLNASVECRAHYPYLCFSGVWLGLCHIKDILERLATAKLYSASVPQHQADHSYQDPGADSHGWANQTVANE